MTRAQELLAAKARRVRLARQRVVAVTLAAFVLAWGVVAFDGSMGATTVASTGTTTTTTEDTTTTDSGTSTYSDGSASSAQDDSSAGMTTGQS
jgi:hypothetical protein